MYANIYRELVFFFFCIDYNNSLGVKFDKLCTVIYKLVHVIGTTLST